MAALFLPGADRVGKDMGEDGECWVCPSVTL